VELGWTTDINNNLYKHADGFRDRSIVHNGLWHARLPFILVVRDDPDMISRTRDDYRVQWRTFARCRDKRSEPFVRCGGDNGRSDQRVECACVSQRYRISQRLVARRGDYFAVAMASEWLDNHSIHWSPSSDEAIATGWFDLPVIITRLLPRAPLMTN